MENKAHYALIGTFVLTAIIGIVAFITFLTGGTFDDAVDKYVIKFDGPVRGISVGGEVKYSGIKVGEIQSVRLDPASPQIVLVAIEVQKDTPLYTGSFAQLEPQGLTGQNYVQLFAGEQRLTLMKDQKNVNPPYIIESKPAQIENLIDGGASVINNAGDALNRLSLFLSEDAVDDFQGILNNLNSITGELAQAGISGDRVNAILGSMEKAGQDMSDATEAIAGLAKSLEEGTAVRVDEFVVKAKNSLEKIDTAFDGIADFAQGGTQTVMTVRESIRDLTQTALSDMTDATSEFRRLAETLNRIADELERNPSAFIVGTEKPLVKLPE